MARKRKKAVSLAGGGRLVEADVEDPYQPGRRERVKRAVYGSSIEEIARRGHLKSRHEPRDYTESRLETARKFADLIEREEAGGGTNFPRNEFVDRTFVPQTVSDRRANAAKLLAQIVLLIGVDGRNFLVDVVVLGRGAEYYLKSKRMKRSVENRNAYYQRIRDTLDAVSEVFGVAKGRARVEIRSYMSA